MAGPGAFGGFDPPDEAIPTPTPGVVDLAHGNLREFPAFTKALRTALELDLEGNPELVSIPAGALSRLTSLETLRLTGCALTHLPEDMNRCESIARLFAGANHITDAHPAFELPCAVHVGLAHNRIAALPPPEVTARAEALMSLDLTHNDMCDAADAFASLRAMPSLRALSLAGNPMAMGTGFAARVANELPELLMLDGARLEHAARGPIPSMDDEEATPTTTLTVKFKVTDASCEPDPPPPTDPNDDDEAKKTADDKDDVKAEGDAEGGEGEGEGEGEDDVPAEGEGGAEGEGDGEAAGGDAEGDAEEAAPTDEAEFFVRFSLAACGGDDADALAEPFSIPRRPRTVPEPPEGAAKGEGDGDGGGDGGDAPEEAAAEGEGEGEGEEAAAPTPPVEEPDDPATTFYADLPLTLATRDLLHRGVRFEMCKVETVPKPPAEESKETTGDAADGGDKPEGEPEAEPAEGSEAQSELVERVTVVGVATVRLGSLLFGGVKEWRGEVDFFREAPMYRKTAVGEVLVALGGDGSGAGESAGRATVTCVMHATRPAVEGEGADEEGEEAAAEE
jgi:hypothetical protein